ncbi:MAG: YopX family protein [Treponema sp.]|jgi:uncharacterized phage protein (TIGR01671 family)|nr:YopX family protein [Treponema sp.]
MRDIEFRGKDIETGKWAFGSLLIREEKSPVPETTETYKKYFIVNGGFENYEYEVIPETVGQYTGLKDKNGAKIFEGDTLHIEDRYCENGIEFDIEFDEDSCCYISLGTNIEINRENMLMCEVIGNIQDNPELLRVNNS